MLNYSSTSWHARLYISSYGIKGENPYLPNNICVYFWKLLLAIILFIPAYIGHIMNFFKKGKLSYHNEGYIAIWSSVQLPIFLLMGFAMKNAGDSASVIKFSFGHDYITGILWSMVWVICIAIVIFLIIYGEKLGDYISSSLRKMRRRKGIEKDMLIPRSNPIIDGFEAFKGKYCSKIGWDGFAPSTSVSQYQEYVNEQIKKAE
jgi:hypothetical protein